MLIKTECAFYFFRHVKVKERRRFLKPRLIEELKEERGIWDLQCEFIYSRFQNLMMNQSQIGKLQRSARSRY